MQKPVGTIARAPGASARGSPSGTAARRSMPAAPWVSIGRAAAGPRQSGPGGGWTETLIDRHDRRKARRALPRPIKDPCKSPGKACRWPVDQRWIANVFRGRLFGCTPRPNCSRSGLINQGLGDLRGQLCLAPPRPWSARGQALRRPRRRVTRTTGVVGPAHDAQGCEPRRWRRSSVAALPAPRLARAFASATGSPVSRPRSRPPAAGTIAVQPRRYGPGCRGFRPARSGSARSAPFFFSLASGRRPRGRQSATAATMTAASTGRAAWQAASIWSAVSQFLDPFLPPAAPTSAGRSRRPGSPRPPARQRSRPRRSPGGPTSGWRGSGPGRSARPSARP